MAEGIKLSSRLRVVVTRKIVNGMSCGNMLAFREKWYGSNWWPRCRLRNFDRDTPKSRVISLVLLHVSLATATIMASSCPGVRTADRQPALSGAVIFTLPVSQRRCCNRRKTLASGWDRPGWCTANYPAFCNIRRICVLLDFSVTNELCAAFCALSTLWKTAFFLGKNNMLRPVLPLLTCEVYIHKLLHYERRIAFFRLFFKQESHFLKLVPEFPFILHAIQISFALWRIKVPRNAYITRSGLEASLCMCSFVSKWEQSDLWNIQCFDTGSNYLEQIATLLFLWHSASS